MFTHSLNINKYTHHHVTCIAKRFKKTNGCLCRDDCIQKGQYTPEFGPVLAFAATQIAMSETTIFPPKPHVFLVVFNGLLPGLLSLHSLPGKFGDGYGSKSIE